MVLTTWLASIMESKRYDGPANMAGIHHGVQAIRWSCQHGWHPSWSPSDTMVLPTWLASIMESKRYDGPANMAGIHHGVQAIRWSCQHGWHPSWSPSDTMVLPTWLASIMESKRYDGPANMAGIHHGVQAIRWSCQHGWHPSWSPSPSQTADTWRHRHSLQRIRSAVNGRQAITSISGCPVSEISCYITWDTLLQQRTCGSQSRRHSYMLLLLH